MERLSFGKVVEHYVDELEDVEYYIADEVDKQIEELTELLERMTYISSKTSEYYSWLADVNVAIKKVRG